MEETKNRTIADTFNAKLKTPWVWLIILITLGLTALFYFSQKPSVIVYSRYIKSLSDYQLMELDLMRSMNQVRCGYNADSVRVLACRLGNWQSRSRARWTSFRHTGCRLPRHSRFRDSSARCSRRLPGFAATCPSVGRG